MIKIQLKIFMFLLFLWSATTLAKNIDITSQLSVSSSKLTKIAGGYRTNVVLKNTSKNAISAPIYLKIDTLQPQSLTFVGIKNVKETAKPLTDLILVSTTDLAVGKTLSKSLYFTIPTGTDTKTLISSFSVKPSVWNQQVFENIKELQPQSGASGSEIIITGTDFTPTSKVLVDGQSAFTQYVSETELHFIVPFIPSGNSIAALKAGTYSVEVDGGNSLDLNVVDLPVNPNPAGTVLTNELKTITQGLTDSSKAYKKVLPTMLKQSGTDTDNKNMLNALSKLATQANSQKFDQDLAKLDPKVLEMIERVLLNNQTVVSNNTVQGSVISNRKVQRSTAGTAVYDGDAWLEKRKKWVEQSNAISDTGKYFGLTCKATSFAIGIVQPEAALALTNICTSLVASITVIEILSDVNATQDMGIITGMALNVSGTEYKESSLQINPISLKVDNFNNNETTPTEKAEKILGATIYTSKQIPIAQMAVKLTSALNDIKELGVLEKKGVVATSLEKLSDSIKESIAKQTDNATNQPDKTYQVSMNKLQSTLAVRIMDGDYLPTFFNAPCSVEAGITRTALKVDSQGMITVFDKVAEIPFNGAIDVAICEFKINEDLLLPSEEDIAHFVKFNAKRYAKIDITIEGSGSVAYQIPALSKNTSCSSHCVEYFDAANVANLTLTADKSKVKWSGVACLENKVGCDIKLDGTNTFPPTFTVTFPEESKSGYTKIANDGSELPDSAVLGSKPKDWACTKDNKTGLIWEVKTNDGGLRDRDNLYTNYDEVYPKCDDGIFDWCSVHLGKLGDSTNTDAFVKAVNAQGLCGSSNWRLPTKDELLTISPAVSGTGYFPYFDSSYGSFWSASPYTNYSVYNWSYYAWSVYFLNGDSSYSYKVEPYYVRLVR